MTVDTACSSSIVAMDIAISHIRSSKCNIALVAGVNFIFSPLTFIAECQANMLSAAGRCATFDEGADGYCRGEGVGCVVLKRLSQAQADGDRILAVVKATAVNQDGKSASITAPNGLAQESLIRSALDDAGALGKDIDYVECHGTGTELGDPIEVEALKNVLNESRDSPLILGAVKTNIGHLEGAAGIAGLIKTVLVLQHNMVPPNVHFRKLNPYINIDGFDVIIPTSNIQLNKQTDKKLFAGLSSFGMGGTNSHVILEASTSKKPIMTNHKTLNLSPNFYLGIACSSFYIS